MNLKLWRWGPVIAPFPSPPEAHLFEGHCRTLHPYVLSGLWLLLSETRDMFILGYVTALPLVYGHIITDLLSCPSDTESNS